MFERLSDSGQTRLTILRTFDIIESHQRNVAGAREAGLVEGLDRPHCHKIIETADCCEVCSPSKKISHDRIAQPGAPFVLFQLQA
jgi:hypothetical protein